jgi:hypothetical protein
MTPERVVRFAEWALVCFAAAYFGGHFVVAFVLGRLG